MIDQNPILFQWATSACKHGISDRYPYLSNSLNHVLT